MIWTNQSISANYKDGVLRLVYWQAPSVFNPHLTAGNKDREACRITYEPLATCNADGTLIPILAAEIPDLENGGLASDGTSVTWKLKPGVKWSDGRPFTAHDVRFTWEFIRNPENKAVTVSVYESIRDIEIADDLTLKISFTPSPNPAWKIPFTGSEGMILPRHVFSPLSDGEKGKNTVTGDTAKTLAQVGTGPYHMVGVTVEDTIIMGDDVVNMINIRYALNPHFREKGKHFFKSVELHGGGDAIAAAKAVFVEGSADFGWNLQVSGAKLQKFENRGKGRLVYLKTPNVERILLNFTNPRRQSESGEKSSLKFPHPFLSDKKVRQALAQAIDREAIAALYGDIASPVTNILISPAIYNSPNTGDLYPFNLKQAAKLLDEAGWTDHDGDGFRDKNGIPMKILFQTTANPIRQKTQELIKKSLESIGVDVRLKMIDASVFFGGNPPEDNNFRKFYADMQEYSHNNSTPDPTDYMSWWICDKAAQQANNWSLRNIARWCSPEYDKLSRRVSGELSREKRRKLLIRMNDLLIEEVAVIPLFTRDVATGISQTLKGVRLTPWDASTWNIKDWHRE